MAKQTFLIFLLIATLTACAKAELVSVATEAATPTEVTKTTQEPPATPTRISTHDTTNTAVPTITPESTATQNIAPTETPKQTSVVEPTSTPFTSAAVVLFDLPSWIMEPTANILLLGSQKTYTLSIVNVDIGDRHEIDMKIDGLEPTWFWQGERYLISLRYPRADQSAIDVITGKSVTVPSINRDILSPDGRYAARITGHEDRSEIVSIVDYETNTETELFNPFLHIQSLNESFVESAWTSWSPDGAFLSVIYDKHYYSDRSDQNLAIYTPSGEIYRQYVNINPASWFNQWAPVLPYRIFYTERSRACILEITENKRSCLEAIDGWLDNRDFILLNHDWSPDGTRISYIYHNSELPDTGLCFFEFATENIACPVTSTDLIFDEQMFARRKFWSPDGKYIVLFYDNIGYSEDLIGSVGVIVVDIEHQNFWYIEGEYWWPFSDPWRPTIPSETAE